MSAGKPVELSTQSADPASVDSAPAQAAAPVRDPRRYEVIGEHGRGGLGRVQRAHDVELGRDVAIKELLSRGPVSERRFEREARITARLEHPGIVPLYEAGRWPDGTPFYAMKLVSGRPLRALIAERASVDERIGLLHHVIAVADAMAYAHGRNIIHRDLKPANVIVGDFGETVVIDWGLAKDLTDRSTIGADPSDSPREPELTTAGSVLGTPAYMPPEQERGEAVDQRADVFAIGAMLWELCSLHRVPPRERPLRHRLLRGAGIDDDLIAIIDKAIDPDAARRYRDAGEMAADLRAFKSGARISARRYSLAALLRHWTRRHRALAALALTLAATVIVGIAALAWLYRGSETNAALAHEQLTQSYIEQGRRALLDEGPSAALAFLVEAARRGDQSAELRFMLERAAEPLEHEILRLPALAPRAWSARFSRDGQQILTGDDHAARMWDARSGQLLFSMAHPDIVLSASFIANETRVISVGDQGVVRLWDARTGGLIREMQGVASEGKYRDSAIAPDETRVVVLSTAGGAWVWSLETGTLVNRLSIGPALSHCLAFSRDGRWLAIGDGDVVQVFDTASWQAAATLNVGASALRFSPTESLLMTGTRSGEVALWRMPDGQRLHQLLIGGEAVTAVAFSPDGSLVAAGFSHDAGFEMIWQARSGALLTRTAKRPYGSTQVEFDHTGTLLLSGGYQGQLVISNVVSGVAMLRIHGSPRAVADVHFDRDSHHLIGAMLDGTVRVWDVAPAYQTWATNAVGWDCATDVVPDEDSRFMAVSCPAHTTRVWDVASSTLIAELPASRVPRGNPEVPAAVAAHAAVVAIARDDEVELYELQPSKRLRRSVRHPALLRAMRFVDDRLLVTGSRDGTLKATDDAHERWSISTGADIDAIIALPHHRILVAEATPRLAIYDAETGRELSSIVMMARARALRASQDGRRAIAISPTGHVEDPVLYDLERGTLIARLVGHTTQVYSAQFVRGDREILTAGTDGVAILWDADIGAKKKTFADETMLMDAALSSDGTLLVTAAGDGNLRFWSVATGRTLWRLRAHVSYVPGVHFEGNDLVSRGMEGDLAKWRIPPVRGGAGWLARFEKLVANGPWRLDPATGALVAKAGRQ